MLRIRLLLFLNIAPWILLLSFIGLIGGCGRFQKDVTVDLPPYVNQLVIECYLEAGQQPSVLLTESSGYFDSPALPLVNNATVTLLNTTTGRGEVLRQSNAINFSTRKGYNFIGSRFIAPNTGQTYQIEAADDKGRRVVGITTFLPPPQFTSIEAKFNDQNKAFLFIRFPDNDPNASNYYRMVINRDSLTGFRESDFTFDARFTTNNEVTIGTNYRYEVGDTVVVSLYHIEKPFYDFLRSVQDAARANGNPFAQPTTIRSTVQGGFGVVAALAYDRRMFIIKEDELIYLPLPLR